MNLPFYNHGINDVAAVVYRDKATDRHLTAPLVNINYADVGSKRESQVRWIVIINRFQSRLQSRRNVGVRSKSDLLNGFGFPWSAFDEEFARFPLQVLFAGFQQMSS